LGAPLIISHNVLIVTVKDTLCGRQTNPWLQ
jgi:hypothetical protein